MDKIKGLCMVALCVSPSAQAATPAVNKRITLEFFEKVLSQGHLERYAESHAPTFIAHGESDATLDDDMAAAREERLALPDMLVSVQKSVAEKDMVAVYWTASGTNTHAGMGLPGNGRKIKTHGMTIFRLENAKIVEEWSVWDMYSVLRQAGALDKPQ